MCLKRCIKKNNINCFSFDWYITDTYEPMMPQLAMYMLNEIGKDSFVDLSQMVKFVLTVQKSYHNHPYHNFIHAFTVTHCMYNIVKRNMDSFTMLEVNCYYIYYENYIIISHIHAK